MGVVLGWPRILIALLAAYILGATVGLVLIGLKKKTLGSRVPFGTYLTVGTLLALFLGDRIVSWYLEMLS